MEPTKEVQLSAIEIPTQFIEVGLTKIAYRSLGEGKTILLCNRFRGILDTWDPLFLDSLARKNRVIIFDYPGIGLSTGELPVTSLGVATAVKELAEALELKKFTLAGWSYGGTVAQTFAAHFPELISHLIIIGSNPPGNNATPPEQVFFDAALKPVNDLADETILFFEPASKASVKAAKKSNKRIAARKTDLSIMVTPEKFNNYFLGGADFKEDSYQSREKLASSKIPILILMGDHDPSFPVENWFPIVKTWKTAQLIILPSSGHGPQHEFPKLTTRYMASFIKWS
ncbi:alpha/beta fold hydrolase [Pedobacter sp. GSP4]|uniref:alpha/beta fold hydrolase n=1 Tax=Pedobacter sp. GSP4 TaxID=3453716 RepID=UPI003EEA17C8